MTGANEASAPPMETYGENLIRRIEEVERQRDEAVEKMWELMTETGVHIPAVAWRKFDDWIKSPW